MTGDLGETEVLLASLWVCGDLFAIDASHVQEMVHLGELTKVASAPPFVMGVMNLRGKIICVADLAALISAGESRVGLGADTRVVIMNDGGVLIGLCVDKLEDVFEVERATIQPPFGHTALQDLHCRGVIERHKRHILLLDVPHMLELSRGEG